METHEYASFKPLKHLERKHRRESPGPANKAGTKLSPDDRVPASKDKPDSDVSKGGETVSILEDYMRDALLRAMMPAVNKVQSDIHDQIRSSVSCPQFTQTVITINPPRHYPARAYRRH